MDSKVAFKSNRLGGHKNYEIFVINIDGADELNLTNYPGWQRHRSFLATYRTTDANAFGNAVEYTHRDPDGPLKLLLLPKLPQRLLQKRQRQLRLKHQQKPRQSPQPKRLLKLLPKHLLRLLLRLLLKYFYRNSYSNSHRNAYTYCDLNPNSNSHPNSSV